MRLHWVLSHWAHFTMRRFICVYLCVFCVFFYIAYLLYYCECSEVELMGFKPTSAKAKATDVKVETRVKEWLKFAAERDGGRKQRIEQKRCDNCQARNHDLSDTE